MTEKKVKTSPPDKVPVTDQDVFYATVDLTREFLKNPNNGFGSWSDVNMQSRLSSFISATHKYLESLKD